jgi:hypothetical protein
MSPSRRDPKVRASDADREAVAEQLREHFATGRLSMDDLDERLDRAYAAQTYGDLEPLVVDLPGPEPYSDLPVPFPGTSHPGPGSSVARFERGWSGLQHRNADWGAWASASAVCWAIWLASFISGGSVSGFWPVWVMLPWGGILLAASFTGDDRHAVQPPSKAALPPAEAPDQPLDQQQSVQPPLPALPAPLSSRRADRMARRNARIRRRLE